MRESSFIEEEIRIRKILQQYIILIQFVKFLYSTGIIEKKHYNTFCSKYIKFITKGSSKSVKDSIKEHLKIIEYKIFKREDFYVSFEEGESIEYNEEEFFELFFKTEEED